MMRSHCRIAAVAILLCASIPIKTEAQSEEIGDCSAVCSPLTSCTTNCLDGQQFSTCDEYGTCFIPPPVCGNAHCELGETCSDCPADCQSRCLSYTLSSDLKKSGCAGDDDSDCLDNALEEDLAWIVAPHYFYDEDENCSGAWYTETWDWNLYGRRDFYQVRPQGDPENWQSDGTWKTVGLTYFLLHPHDCQDRPILGGGHQGDSEHVRFLLKSRDLRSWVLVDSEYNHHHRMDNFSGEYLKNRAIEIGSAYASIAADEDGHGSWPGRSGGSSDCAGSEDAFCFSTCDCFRGSMKGALNNGYWSWVGSSRNVGGPSPESWRPSVVTVSGNHAYSTMNVGQGNLIEYWTVRSDEFRKFCGWECSSRQSNGNCNEVVHTETSCSSPLSEKLDTTGFTPPNSASVQFRPAKSRWEALDLIPVRHLLGVWVAGLPHLTREEIAYWRQEVATAEDPVAVVVPMLQGQSRQDQVRRLGWLLSAPKGKFVSAINAGLLEPSPLSQEQRAGLTEPLLQALIREIQSPGHEVP